MSVLHFSHTGICVSDLDRSTAFYRDVLGFKEHHRLHFADDGSSKLLRLENASFEVVYLERDGTVIELLFFEERVVTQDAWPRDVNKLGLTHLSFNVSEIENLSAAVEAAGGRILEQTRLGEVGSPVVALFATDPDGTLLEFVQSPADPTRLPLQPDNLER